MDQHYYEEERQRLEYYWAERNRMVGGLYCMPPELAYPEAVLDNPFASRRFMTGEEQVQSDHQDQDAHASSVQSVHNAFEDPRLNDNDYNKNPFYAENLDLNVMSPQQAENAVEGPAVQQHQHDATQGGHYIPIDPDLENQSIIAVQPAQNALEVSSNAVAGNSEHPSVGNFVPDYIYESQASSMNFQPDHAGKTKDLIEDGFSLVYPVYGPVFGTPAEHGHPAVVPQEHEGQEQQDNQGPQYSEQQLQFQYQQYPQDGNNEYPIHGQGHHDQGLHQQHEHHIHQDHVFNQPQQDQHHHGDDQNAPVEEDDNHYAAVAPSLIAQGNNHQAAAAANVQAPQARPRGRQSHNATIPRVQHNDDSKIPDPLHYGLAKVQARPPCQEITRIFRGQQKTLIQCNRCEETRSRRDEMRWHLRWEHYGREYPPHGCHVKKGREQALLDCP
ncbi:hypothetical protein CSAL01_11789 [Colletotrichum salicis]|uniref:C2H2-type domain-containing protein n=1 Tax=Colletotrichum salicis TaxID=1209931 RepID=A0A135U5U8_9PEZI|nr:hypothetical protein CSAL01_11789 [Colletotrichum salicis]